MRIARRLFVVPLANNDHGKTTMLKALVSQGGHPQFDRLRKSVRGLVSPWGRVIDAFIFGRSYQETEKSQHGGVIAALDASDPQWRERELIIMPSHVIESEADIDEMLEAAHGAGFDAICASVIFVGENQARQLAAYSTIWSKNWDERWTIPNPRREPDDRELEFPAMRAGMRPLDMDLPGIGVMSQLVVSSAQPPTLIAVAGERAQIRFWEFFVSNIRNPNTRRAYGRAVGDFLAWCERRGAASIAEVQPLHVGAYVELLTRERSAPTAKQNLAAIRMLFDWLVTGQIVRINPASSVRGPKHIVKVGKTAVLDPD